MQIIIFEDEKTLRFRPLVNMKPVYGLHAGCRTLKEKFEDEASGKLRLTWHLRHCLAPWFREENPGATVNTIEEDDLMLVNGRLLCDSMVIGLITRSGLEPGMAITQGGNMLVCRMSAKSLANQQRTGDPGLLPDLVNTEAIYSGVLTTIGTTEARILENIWDPVAVHPAEMQREAACFQSGLIAGAVHPSAVLINPSNISIGEGAVVMACAVLDASEGFIHVAPGAVIEPHAVLMQNVCIAPGARVRAAARIYSNVFVGRSSKVGGEVEDSIIEPYSNKQHDGFLGHSYISSWCNLGAGTNTSDLKNNYSKVSLVLDGRQVPTGLQFLGLLMAEHSKCSIGSMFNTGTVVGNAANIFGSGMPPKDVPSFSWGNGVSGFEPYQVDKAVETARAVMQRRKVVMSGVCEEMFRHVARLATTGGSPAAPDGHKGE